MGEAIDFVVETGDGRKDWRVRFYDARDGQFYGGSDQGSVWMAIAWALDERAHRRAGIVRIAHAPDAKPTLVVSASRVAAEVDRRSDSMRLPLAGGACVKGKSAAARRSRARKTK